MWKEYSINYIKNNKASSISIMTAALIATMFLSVLCSLFFNMWIYDVDQIVYEEGDWQARLIGSFRDETINSMENYGNIERLNIKFSTSEEMTVEIYMKNKRTIYQELPVLLEKLGLNQASLQYHDTLLSQYLIFDPQEKQPSLLLLFFIAVLSIAGVSLILIIRNAFSVSMMARIHQFGMFSSIGATPRQISVCLLQEAAALCILPMLLGSLAGIGICIGFVAFANHVAEGVQTTKAVFHYHVGIWLVTLLAAGLTVFLSAWLPARRLSRMSLLEAIRMDTERQGKEEKKFPVLTFLFGMEGELAGVALRARKKAMRTTTLSLTLSFLAFTMFLCFMTLSGISVKYTYFERYKDAWDIMATIKATAITDFDAGKEIAGLDNIESLVIYQKATVYTTITQQQQSDELLALGGLSGLIGKAVRAEDNSYLVEMPIIVLDEEGFAEYCDNIGMKSVTKGGIIINRVWDSRNSNFRHPEYIPYIKETDKTWILKDENGTTVDELPILGYVSDAPVLREEYSKYALVQIIPISVWNIFRDKIDAVDADTFLRILVTDDTRMNEDMMDVKTILESRYRIEIENRVQEELTNNQMRKGYVLIIGLLCAFLAVIGIANLFSVTLGFLYQRKREFARYLSIGVTPAGIRKILILEALSIAGRPLLITVPLTILFVLYALKASYLEPMEFLRNIPILPIALFIFLIFFFVGIAYYIGGRKIVHCNLCEALRDDTLI